MKKILTVLLSFCLHPVFAQDTTYLDRDSKEISASEDWQYYQVITKISPKSDTAIIREYYKTGNQKTEQYILYKDKIGQFIGGPIKEWYDNGQLRRNYNYKGAINLDGEVLTYYKTGELKRKDLYKEGKLVKGNIYSIDGIEVPYSDFIMDAAYPGGNNELIAFLLKNLKYPKRAKKNNIEGKVYVKFRVDEKGRITDAKVVKSVDEDLDEEALRVVNKMPNWSPYMIDGEIKASYLMLPVSFTLTND